MYLLISINIFKKVILDDMLKKEYTLGKTTVTTVTNIKIFSIT